MNRAHQILEMILDFLPEAEGEGNEPENQERHKLQGATGYTYQDRGQKGIKTQMKDGKRPAGLRTKAGKSS
jgi:hypothetical protein